MQFVIIIMNWNITMIDNSKPYQFPYFDPPAPTLTLTDDNKQTFYRLKGAMD